MVAPLVAAAGISAAASLFSEITGGKGAKKAAKIAAKSAAADRAQALQIYNTNMGMAQPGVDRGNAAGAQINALLGLGGDTTGANDALARFKASTGYQGRLEEGQRAINTGYAARGALESGAAQKALLNYGQQQASGEFGNYLNALGGQQAAGQNALGAATGAGVAFGNQSAQANQSQASAQANAALYGAQAQQNALAGIAGAAGREFGQSSYRQPMAGAAPNMLPSMGGMTTIPFGIPGYGGGTFPLGGGGLTRNPFGG
jgi:hypothetical protein